VSLGFFIRITDPADYINSRLLIGSGTPNDPFIMDGEDPGDVIEVPRPQGLVDLSDDEDDAGITVDKAKGSTADGELEGDDVGAEVDVQDDETLKALEVMKAMRIGRVVRTGSGGAYITSSTAPQVMILFTSIKTAMSISSGLVLGSSGYCYFLFFVLYSLIYITLGIEVCLPYI
jgi:hypothetical protein